MQGLPSHDPSSLLSSPRSAIPSVVPKVKLSIVFESGARIGPENAALLEGIRKTGSISAAARDMGIPYKRAWLRLDSMNRTFKESIIEAATGGAGGAPRPADGREPSTQIRFSSQRRVGRRGRARQGRPQ
jgi:hypothetical protein